jgi:nucleoside-diphosphate-sugar epimerase
MKILVLGHTGFIGKNIYKKLKKDSFDVTGASLSQGTDLRIEANLVKILKENEIQIIINCAAHVGGIHYGLRNGISIFEDNILMNINILKAASQVNAQIINLISNCTYPGKHSEYIESNYWEGEIEPTVINYGIAKKAVVVLSKEYSRSRGLNVFNLVMPNVFGPGDHLDPEKAHALGGIISRMIIARDNNIPEFQIWGTGRPIREWLYIDDAVEIVLSMIGKRSNGEIVNIKGNGIISIYDLTIEIANLLRFTGKISLDPSKPDGAMAKTMNTVKFEKMFGNRQRTDFKIGLNETVRWYEKELRLEAHSE